MFPGMRAAVSGFSGSSGSRGSPKDCSGLRRVVQ